MKQGVWKVVGAWRRETGALGGSGEWCSDDAVGAWRLAVCDARQAIWT